VPAAAIQGVRARSAEEDVPERASQHDVIPVPAVDDRGHRPEADRVRAVAGVDEHLSVSVVGSRAAHAVALNPRAAAAGVNERPGIGDLKLLLIRYDADTVRLAVLRLVHQHSGGSRRADAARRRDLAFGRKLHVHELGGRRPSRRRK
jgi:hypothetical protein